MAPYRLASPRLKVRGDLNTATNATLSGPETITRRRPTTFACVNASAEACTTWKFSHYKVLAIAPMQRQGKQCACDCAATADWTYFCWLVVVARISAYVLVERRTKHRRQGILLTQKKEECCDDGYVYTHVSIDSYDVAASEQALTSKAKGVAKRENLGQQSWTVYLPSIYAPPFSV